MTKASADWESLKASIDDALARTAKFEVPLQLMQLQKPGDIILVRSGKSWLSRIYQSMSCPAVYRHGLQAWRKLPSHALIVVHPGLYMEAMPGQGVRLVKAESCRPGTYDHFQVLRHPTVAGSQAQLDALSGAFEWHYGQFYNYKINLTLWKRKFRSHSYCSQLSASIYEQLGMSLCGRPSNLVLPVHLMGLGLDGEWQDVSAEYHEFDRLQAASTSEYPLFETRRTVAMLRVQQGLKTAGHQQLMLSVNQMPGRINKRLRNHRFLMRISVRLAERYARWAISDRPAERVPLMPDVYLGAFLEVLDLLEEEDVFSTANSWRNSDLKFQDSYRNARQDSAMQHCVSALAYCLAVRTFAVFIILGEDGAHFAANKQRLAEAAAWSDELLVRLQSQSGTLAPHVTGNNTILDLWQACATGFMTIAALRQEVLDAHADPDLIRRGDAFRRVCDRRWADIAGKLAAGDKHMLDIQQIGSLNTIDPAGIVNTLVRAYPAQANAKGGA